MRLFWKYGENEFIRMSIRVERRPYWDHSFLSKI